MKQQLKLTKQNIIEILGLKCCKETTDVLTIVLNNFCLKKSFFLNKMLKWPRMNKILKQSVKVDISFSLRQTTGSSGVGEWHGIGVLITACRPQGSAVQILFMATLSVLFFVFIQYCVCWKIIHKKIHPYGEVTFY